MQPDQSSRAVQGGFPNGAGKDADGLGTSQPPGTPTGYGYADADADPLTISANFPGLLDRKQQDYSARLNWDLGAVTLSTISSFSRVQIDYAEDNDASPADISRFGQSADSKIYTQEVRLSRQQGPFRWTAGVYYLRVDGDYSQYLAFPIFGTQSTANYSVDTRSWAVFGQSEYDVSDKFSVVAGLRYTRDKKHYFYARNCVGPLCAAFDAPGSIGVQPFVRDTHSEGDWSGRFVLNYKPSDDTLLYASINRGYKAFNYNAGFAGSTLLQNVRFKGEILTAYEMGSKTELFDRVVRLNAAAFYYDYSDYQAFDPRGLNFTLVNTDATIYGLDADLTLRPGWGFTFLGGIGLVNTKVKGIIIGGVPRDREAAQAPKLTLNFAMTKVFDLDFGSLTLTGSGKYSSPQYAILTNPESTRLKRDFVLNGRISFVDPDSKYEVAVSAKNLLNRTREIYAFDLSNPPLGLDRKNIAPPRQVALEVTVNF
jgi:iron complex outermembrane receptor protein